MFLKEKKKLNLLDVVLLLHSVKVVTQFWHSIYYQIKHSVSNPKFKYVSGISILGNSTSSQHFIHHVSPSPSFKLFSLQMKNNSKVQTILLIVFKKKLNGNALLKHHYFYRNYLTTNINKLHTCNLSSIHQLHIYYLVSIVYKLSLSLPIKWLQ